MMIIIGTIWLMVVIFIIREPIINFIKSKMTKKYCENCGRDLKEYDKDFIKPEKLPYYTDGIENCYFCSKCSKEDI